jgi:hypothetical protein
MGNQPTNSIEELGLKDEQDVADMIKKIRHDNRENHI